MKEKIFSILYSFKKLIIAAVVIILGLVVLTKILPAVMQIRANTSPIVSIDAENDTVYKVSDTIRAQDFTVTATHENGQHSRVDPENIELSRTSLKAVGTETILTIALADAPDIECEATVQVEREPIVGFQCGYPDVTNVIAVLYSNGELCFEGEGDILVFDQGEFPWMDYEDMNDNPIYSVTFSDGVEPTNMNYWFENMETIKYVGKIPSSVRTMVGTFTGCTGLTSTPDWSECDGLLNVNYAFSECQSLTEASAFVPSIRTAEGTFTGCTNLVTAPDLTGAENLVNMTEMFSGASRLSDVVIAPNAEDLTGTFQDCINLKDMPEIPATVLSMADTFSGAVSLSTLTSIPAFVQDTTNAFSGCELISGSFAIEAEPADYGGMFSGAAIATRVDLTGSSGLLDEMALTSDGFNITVNGNVPVEEE